MSSILLPERGPGQTIRGSTVTSNEFNSFLSEVLPPFGLCPSAYRRRNIRRRIVRRMESAGIHKLRHYLDLVQVDPVSLERAEAGSYPESSPQELLAALRRKYFRREGHMYRICEAVRRSVQFRKLDLLRDPPSGRFDLILCRNAAFTYFNPVKCLAVAGTFATALQEDGYLVIGGTESLPRETVDLFEPVFPAGKIYRFRSAR